MPFRLPFNFPFGYNRPIYPRFNTFHYSYGNYKSENLKHNNNFQANTSQNKKRRSFNDSPNIIDSSKDNQKENDFSEPFLELLGIKLYFDNIIIIYLLFFLYTENVNDEELFICLILLLLS